MTVLSLKVSVCSTQTRLYKLSSVRTCFEWQPKTLPPYSPPGCFPLSPWSLSKNYIFFWLDAMNHTSSNKHCVDRIVPWKRRSNPAYFPIYTPGLLLFKVGVIVGLSDLECYIGPFEMGGSKVLFWQSATYFLWSIPMKPMISKLFDLWPCQNDHELVFTAGTFPGTQKPFQEPDTKFTSSAIVSSVPALEVVLSDSLEIGWTLH